MTFTIGSDVIEEEFEETKQERKRSVWLVKEVNRYKRYGTRNQKRLYPSTATECPRQNFLALQEEFDTEMSISGIGITSIGNALHDTIQEAIKSGHPEALIEFPVRDDENKLSGRADIIMRDDDGSVFIIDIKTAGYLPKQPRSYHIAQLAVYAIMTGIMDTQLLYVKRDVKGDKLNMKAFVVDFTTAKYRPKFNKALRVIAESLVADKHKLLPKRKVMKAHCGKFCPFIDVCWTIKNDALEVSYDEFDTDEYLEEIIEQENALLVAGQAKGKEINALLK